MWGQHEQRECGDGISNASVGTVEAVSYTHLLAEGIIEKDSNIKSWTEADQHADDQIHITAEREGEVPGTHIIKWESEADAITIEHRAKSRMGFALGAVMAAEWACGKKGFLTMDEMMHSLVAESQLLDIIK